MGFPGKLFKSTVFLACFLGAHHVSYAAPAESTRSVRGAPMKSPSLIVLSRAKRFESRQVGEGASSTVYGAYADALKNIASISPDDLDWLKRNAEGGAKIYAALLLLAKNGNHAEDALVNLLDDKSQVQYQSGCEVFDASISSIAKDLVCTNQFMDFKIGTASGVKTEQPVYITELLRADLFADQTPGESGPHRASLVFAAARDNLKELKLEDLQTLMNKAKPAGKLYAASLISLKNSSRKSFDGLLADNSPVTYVGGCKGFQTTTAEIARELKDKGKYCGFNLQTK
jgi:hypothetical protein